MRFFRGKSFDCRTSASGPSWSILTNELQLGGSTTNEQVAGRKKKATIIPNPKASIVKGYPKTLYLNLIPMIPSRLVTYKHT